MRRRAFLLTVPAVAVGASALARAGTRGWVALARPEKVALACNRKVDAEALLAAREANAELIKAFDGRLPAIVDQWGDREGDMWWECVYSPLGSGHEISRHDAAQGLATVARREGVVAFHDPNKRPPWLRPVVDWRSTTREHPSTAIEGPVTADLGLDGLVRISFRGRTRA